MFEGVLLNAILEQVGAQGEDLTARALNHLRRAADRGRQEWPVILAFSRNGKLLPSVIKNMDRIPER